MWRRLIYFVFILFNSYRLCGQEITVYNHTFNNLYLINPAAAGSLGHGVGYITYHRYWIGVDGAPESTSFSFNAPTKGEKVGLGFNLFNDRRSILSSSGGIFTFGYSIPFSDVSHLRFGISGGLSYNSFDLDKVVIIDQDDEALANKLNNSISPDGNFGIQLDLNKFHAGFSMPKLFTTPVISSDKIAKAEFQQFDNLLLNMGVRFQIVPKKIAFHPMVIYRMYKGNPGQFEANSILTFNESVWIGGNYRQEYGFSALVGLKIKRLSIGYAYEVPSSDINKYVGASHEIQLAVHFGKKKVEKKPVPVPQKKPTAVTKPPVKPPVTTTSKPVITTPKRDSVVRPKEPVIVKPQPDVVVIPKEEPVIIKSPPKEEPVIVKTSPPPVVIKKDTVAKKIIYDTGTKTIVVPDNEKIVVARKGTHPLELQSGNYVIVGAFSVFENAQKFKNKLADKGYPSHVGYNSDKKLFYTYIFSHDEIDKAIDWKNELRSKEGFQDSWLFIVE